MVAPDEDEPALPTSTDSEPRGRARPTLQSVKEAGGKLKPPPEESAGARVLIWVLVPFAATYMVIRWLLGELGHGLRLAGRALSHGAHALVSLAGSAGRAL